MKKIFILNLIILSIFSTLLIKQSLCIAQTIDITIKGIDDGIITNKQQDYKEAVMNAKLEAIERAGVEIESITKVVNFIVKYDMVESKAKAILLPGFHIMDLGYQKDNTYLVVLSGKVQSGGVMTKREDTFSSLISMGNEALESGNPQKAIECAEEAMKIPGFEGNKDSKWLIQLANKEITRRKDARLVYSSEDNILVQKETWSKKFTIDEDSNPKILTLTVEAFTKSFESDHDYSPAAWRSLDGYLSNNPTHAIISISEGKTKRELVIKNNDVKWGKGWNPDPSDILYTLYDTSSFNFNGATDHFYYSIIFDIRRGNEWSKNYDKSAILGVLIDSIHIERTDLGF
ncbi:MAG: hypothetical protein ISS28_07300 [Candidatus Cloacimonetes bacterium]|nr:hypothetical protein [Candidatus Cloacimonadota bacterium]